MSWHRVKSAVAASVGWLVVFMLLCMPLSFVALFWWHS